MENKTRPETMEQRIGKAMARIKSSYLEAGLVTKKEGDDLLEPSRKYLEGDKEPLLEIYRRNKERADREYDETMNPRAWRHASNVTHALEDFFKLVD